MKCYKYLLTCRSRLIPFLAPVTCLHHTGNDDVIEKKRKKRIPRLHVHARSLDFSNK